MTIHTTPPRCLTIAGSDPSGGAGIQADLKTFQTLKTYGMSAITAVTVQNTMGVRTIHAIPPQIIAGQIEAILEDVGCNAIKTGMLQDKTTISTVAGALQGIPDLRLVVDPVMVATSGASLISPDAVACMRDKLFPLATLVTPNLPEAERLAGIKIMSRVDMKKAAQILLECSGAVLVKGGHSPDPDFCADLLVLRDGRSLWLEFPKIKTKNTHGTGCTLAAAITAGLAKGFDLIDAVTQGRKWLQGAIASAASFNLGKGAGSLDHAYTFTPEPDTEPESAEPRG